MPSWRCVSCKLLNSSLRLNCQACFTKRKPGKPAIVNVNATPEQIAFGYVRRININNNVYIPKEVILVILMFYCKNTFVYVIGNNQYAQFGVGHHHNLFSLTKQKYKYNYNIQHIYNGYGYSIYCDHNNHNYWGAGNNGRGQCCIINNTIINCNTKLTPITSFTHKNIIIKRIFMNCVSKTTFWMDINNNIYGNGCNEYYQLGLVNDNNDKYEAVCIKYLKNIIDIQCAHNYTMCLDKYGNVFSTGYDLYGFTKIKQLNNVNIIAIKTGYSHSLFLTLSGILYCCGRGSSGQLGLGQNIFVCTGPITNKYFANNNIKVVDIAVGSHHNLCCDIHKKIYCFGMNDVGQCGDGSFENVLAPKQIMTLKDETIIKIKCGFNHSYALSSSNNHYLWGNNHYNQCIVKNNESPINTPYLINDIIQKETNNQDIKDICLGYASTQIIVYQK